eukprot:scaffold779_cov92-Cylindrotheca_fusiformis.AAC.4
MGPEQAASIPESIDLLKEDKGGDDHDLNSTVLVPDDIIQEAKWVRIDDRRGIWGEPTVVAPVETPMMEEREQNGTVDVPPEQEQQQRSTEEEEGNDDKEEALRDWPDGVTSIVRNSGSSNGAHPPVRMDPEQKTMATTIPESIDQLEEDHQDDEVEKEDYTVVPEEIIQEAKWVPIDDGRGIWGEPSARSSEVEVPTETEIPEEQEQNGTVGVPPQQEEQEHSTKQENDEDDEKEEALDDDWLDDVTTLLRNSSSITRSERMGPMIMATIPESSFDLEEEEEGDDDEEEELSCTVELEEMQETKITVVVSPSPPASPPPPPTKFSLEPRESSGSLWKGLAGLVEDDDDEDDVDGAMSSLCDSSLETTSEDEADMIQGTSWESIIDPVSFESVVPDIARRRDAKNNKCKMKTCCWDSLLEPLRGSVGRRLLVGGPPSSCSVTESLDTLSKMMSFNYLFGPIPPKNGYSTSMNLKFNMNYDLGLHVRKVENNNIIIASLTEDSRLAQMGYQPGMRICTINDEPCPTSVTLVRELMQIKLEAVDEQTNVTKIITFDANEKNLDLHMHKISKDSPETYITKVEVGSRLNYAGFDAGMRITKINDRPCPETFLDMVKVMTVKISAAPIVDEGDAKDTEISSHSHVNSTIPSTDKEEDDGNGMERICDASESNCPDLIATTTTSTTTPPVQEADPPNSSSDLSTPPSSTSTQKETISMTGSDPQEQNTRTAEMDSSSKTTTSNTSRRPISKLLLDEENDRQW